MIYRDQCSSPLGVITMASDGSSLTGLWMSGQKYSMEKLSGACEAKQLDIFRETREWLAIYFQGKDPGFTPPLSLQGTPFRLSVWEILRRIPYGEVVTYGEIAREIAAGRGIAAMSAQAVGGAVGHNPVSIIVPCHRVIGADRSLTGYTGGLEKKRYLLALEGIRIGQ